MEQLGCWLDEKKGGHCIKSNQRENEREKTFGPQLREIMVKERQNKQTAKLLRKITFS